MFREDFTNLIDETLVSLFTGSNITNLFPRQEALVIGCVMLGVVFDKEICKIIQPNIVVEIDKFAILIQG